MTRVLPLFLLVAAMNANALAAVPDPYARTDRPAVGPAPVPVMEQMFWVQMKLDPATDVKVTCPDGVKLIDRTKPAAGRQWTRFYFRADRGIPKAEILFTVAGRAPVVVPLRVLSYREDIEDKSRDLAGFTDAAHKRGRSHYTDAMIAQAKANLASHPDLKSGLARKSKYETMSDDALWQGLPSWSVPRQLYGNWPCPFCGDKIYAKNAFYPWQASGQFHSKCPLCKRVFIIQIQYRYAFLEYDGASVKALVNEMHGTARQLYPVLHSLALGMETGEAWQEGGMDIDHLSRKCFYDR